MKTTSLVSNVMRAAVLCTVERMMEECEGLAVSVIDAVVDDEPVTFGSLDEVNQALRLGILDADGQLHPLFREALRRIPA